jgi:hypothetical protein
MIAEALKLVQDTAVKASSPKDLPSESSHVSRRLLPTGEVDTTTAAIPPRKHVVYDIDSLSAFVADADNVVVWHDNQQVVAVLNDEGYRDSRLCMPLPIHPTFTALGNCQNLNFTQRDLIDYVRLNLKKEVDTALPGFVAALRAVKIEKDESGESDLQHGRESMGRRIKQSVTGIDALPEDFVLVVPLWLHLDAVVQVECALVIDTMKETFRFGPKPGAIEQAKVAGQKWLGQTLESACDKAVVYFGGPEAK